jgi:D-alanyl-D-alanine carboxypeptidase (penicillin-binding protein 5/6)
MQLIAVVLGAPTSAKRFSSAKALLDYGFANYKITKLIDEGEEVCEADVENGTEQTVRVTAAESKTVLTEKSESSEAERVVYLNEGIKAPISKGDKLGTAEFIINGATVESTDLLAAEDVLQKSIAGIMRDIVIGFI